MKLSRQLVVIQSVIIALLVIGYAWLSLINIRQLTIQELVNQSNTSVQYLVAPIQKAVVDGNEQAYKSKIDTYYDSGNYSRISLFGNDDLMPRLYERNDLDQTAQVPVWFIKLFPVEPIVGKKEIYQGLDRLAYLEVQIHPFAFYQFVWKQFVDIIAVTVFVALVAWALGFALINIVLQPILAVKKQAAAVTNKHFPQITTHSGIAEFEQLIEVHNAMTNQVKALFSQQQQQLDSLKDNLYHEASSGLPNREYFQLTLSDFLNRKNERLMGGLVMIHLHDITKLRHDESFSAYQEVVEYVIKVVERVTGMGKNAPLFQLNEQDFALLLLHQGTSEILEYSKLIVRQLEDCEALEQLGGCYLGASEILEQDTPQSITTRTDEALKYAKKTDKRFYMDKSNGESNSNALFKSKEELIHAIDRARIEFFVQPVVDPVSNEKLFTELYTKLSVDEVTLSLPQILILAEKYEVTENLDKKILLEVQKHFQLGALNGKISINVSAFSFHSTAFQTWLFTWLSEEPDVAKSIIMEFDEIDLAHTTQARDISYKLANNGVEVAIDHFGRGSSSLSRFSDMKLHWLKIDSRYIQKDLTNTNRDYLKMICELVDKLGVKAIIPNIETDEQVTLAQEVGCAGIQGFKIAKPVSIFEQI